MAAYIDQVPFSGIIRIRDMMYSVANPFRLDQGDVSFDSPDSVKNAMTRAIEENKTHYLQTTGVPRLRELIAAKLRDKNRIPIDDADEVLVTNGGIHGIYIVCRALLEAGDEVLVPDPLWPAAAGNVLAAQAMPVSWPLQDRGNGWRYDLAASTARITPKTRAIYLNSPHNPTGAVLSRDDVVRIAAIAQDRNLWVLSDEAYEDVVYDGEHVSIASLPGMIERTIPMYTFSKSYAMTGLRLGYVAIRDPKIRERAKKILFYTASNISSVVQFGGIGALEGPQDSIEAFRTELQARRDLFYSGIEKMGGGTLHGYAAGGSVLCLPQGRPRLVGWFCRDAVAVVANDGVSDQERPDRIRSRRGLWRAWRGLHPLLLRARSPGTERRARVDERPLQSFFRSPPLTSSLSVSFSTFWSRVAASFQMAAAIDADRFAGDEVAVEQREDRFRDFVLAAPSSERRRLLDAFHLVVGRVGRARGSGPGAMALTRMLSAASSSASASVSAITPALAT